LLEDAQVQPFLNYLGLRSAGRGQQQGGRDRDAGEPGRAFHGKLLRG
jgi:hypothetical protein